MPVAAGNALGGRALLYYLVPYSAMSIGAFAVIAVRERELNAPVTLDGMAGFGWERPFLGGSMALFMFGFIGLPPTGIFLGKFYAFSAVIERGWAWLAIVGVVSTAVSVYYYAGVIRAMYMQPRELAVAAAGGSPPPRPAARRRGRRVRPRRRRQLRFRRPAARHRPSDAVASLSFPVRLVPRRVVVLGAGVTGEAFLAALAKLEPETEITIVEHELVGGECSYWACIPSKTLLRPLEVVHRARLAPGVEARPITEVDLAGPLRLARLHGREGRHEPGRVGREAGRQARARARRGQLSPASSPSVRRSCPTTRSSSRRARCRSSRRSKGLESVAALDEPRRDERERGAREPRRRRRRRRRLRAGAALRAPGREGDARAGRTAACSRGSTRRSTAILADRLQEEGVDDPLRREGDPRRGRRRRALPPGARRRATRSRRSASSSPPAAGRTSRASGSRTST